MIYDMSLNPIENNVFEPHHHMFIYPIYKTHMWTKSGD